MEKNKRQTGRIYEQLAGRYLEESGYEILEYNYRGRWGEIDIIAKEGAYLVFCEVKYRAGGCRGNSLEAVDAKKQRKICFTAMQYMAAKKLTDIPCRFDVIGIEGTRIRHIKDAFHG